MEAEAKLKFDLDDGADNMLMGVHLTKVVEANKAFQAKSLDDENTVKLANPVFFAKFVSLFGTSLDKQVLKKAKTIMRQADKDGDNKINIEEFHVIAEKFPNILFPAYKVSDELAAKLM